jgi:hypothetical protein
MTPREQELARLYDCVAGKHWIADWQLMFFVCLTGANPKDAGTLVYEPWDNIGRKIPESYKSNAMALYKIAGSELNKFTSQRLCAAIETFLSTVMTEPELESFKSNTPMKFPFGRYKSILEELEDEK